MPIYGYVCRSCEHSFDALQKMSDDPLVDCPDCGDAALQKQLSAPKFRLKGTGWYETDFKNSGKKAPSDNSSSSAEKSDSSSSTDSTSSEASAS